MITYKKMLVQPGGFTLFEMVLVIAVIAILGLLALPSYQDRIIRQQIQEAIPLTDIAKRPIAAEWALLQTVPADNAATGLPTADRIVNNYVSSVLVRDGAINITFGNRALGPVRGKILTIRPAVVEDAPMVPVTWVCGKADPPDRMVVKGLNQTNIADAYLPFECRRLVAR